MTPDTNTAVTMFGIPRTTCVCATERDVAQQAQAVYQGFPFQAQTNAIFMRRSRTHTEYHSQVFEFFWRCPLPSRALAYKHELTKRVPVAHSSYTCELVADDNVMRDLEES
jgi:hypothetical protein